MKKYYIVAESGADIGEELIAKHDIRIGPMHLSLGGKDYADGKISLDELVNYYTQTGKIPKTSAVSPYEYVQVFQQIKKENPDAIIIHIGYSSVLSTSYHNATLVSEDFKDVYHIDSTNVSIGQGFLVVKAAELIESNPNIDVETLVATIKDYAKKLQFWFIPGNLHYLKAGGRVSNFKSIIASILNIKPVLELIDGKMVATKSFRGSMKKIIPSMIIDYFKKQDLDLDTIYLGYTYKIDEEIKQTMETLVRGLGVKNVVWFVAGPVITSHAGPGGIGIAAIAK